MDRAYRHRRPTAAAAVLLVPMLLAIAALDPRGVDAALRTVNADIVVYGGTPAGVVAAVTAKRADPRITVVLIEPSRHLGGMMSNGLGWTDIGAKSTLGGYTKEVFDRIQLAERTLDGRYHFQPRVAEAAFKAMAASAGVSVRYGLRLRETAAVSKSGARISTIFMSNGQAFRAKTYIDASYEGDLMALAGVTYRVGRESRAAFGESLAGVRPAQQIFALPAGLKMPHTTTAPGPLGSADDRIQDSNYRVCFSSVRTNQVPFAKPLGYDVRDYDVVLEFIRQRAAATSATPQLSWLMYLAPVANRKFDVNSSGLMSLAVTGLNHTYPEASYAERAALDTQHRRWAKGLLHFLRYDPRVPYSIRSKLSGYGLCKDEFTDNANWPRMLYLREGRRMVGAYVLTQDDVQSSRQKSDIIGIASYRVDAHYVSRWVDGDRRVWAEGSMRLPRANYAIPYRIMLPRPTEATNLLVPVTSSVSHVAHASLRMEPHYMLMGEAAGQAAALTIKVRTTTAKGVTFVRKTSISVHAVDPKVVQARLKAHGSRLDQPQ